MAVKRGSVQAKSPGERILPCLPVLATLLLLPLMHEASAHEVGGAASPAAASEESRQDDAYQALLRTYIHGMTDELAQEVLGPDALPLLRRLLFDPAFPRRDNVVAFIAHLDEGEATGDLLAFLANPPAGPAIPEEDRALLLTPVALGHIAHRGDPTALESLLEMTGEDSDPGLLARRRHGETTRHRCAPT